MVSTYDKEAVVVSVVEKDVDPGPASWRRPALHQVADGRPGCDDARRWPSPR
jgi:hypothetical protein